MLNWKDIHVYINTDTIFYSFDQLSNMKCYVNYVSFIMYHVPTVLVVMLDTLIEIRKCCGMEMNTKKCKVMRI
jgi:hypothetical protein